MTWGLTPHAWETLWMIDAADSDGDPAYARQYASAGRFWVACA